MVRSKSYGLPYKQLFFGLFLKFKWDNVRTGHGAECVVICSRYFLVFCRTKASTRPRMSEASTSSSTSCTGSVSSSDSNFVVLECNLLWVPKTLSLSFVGCLKLTWSFVRAFLLCVLQDEKLRQDQECPKPVHRARLLEALRLRHRRTATSSFLSAIYFGYPELILSLSFVGCLRLTWSFVRAFILCFCRTKSFTKTKDVQKQCIELDYSKHSVCVIDGQRLRR